MLSQSLTKFLSSLFIAILVITQTVISPACAVKIATQSTCCCSVEDASIELINYSSQILEQSTPTISDACSCHSRIPDHGLPTTPFKISVNSTLDLQKPAATIILSAYQDHVPLIASKHKPLHLASNKVYLQKRVWLI